MNLDLPARSILAVPRIYHPDIETFEREYARRSMPVVIRGEASQWPACGAWTPERFISVFGDRRALIVRYEGNSSVGGKSVRMPLRNYFAACRSGVDSDDLGWAGEPVAYSLPELAAELRLPYLVRTEHSETAAFISGPRAWPYRHVSNQFHFHPGLHAFAAQLQGQKLFRLYCPSQSRYLGARRPWASMPSRSDLEIHRYDPAVHTGLARATCYQTILETGDLLFIPAAWWHLAANEEFALVVTTFYPAPLTQWRLFTKPGIATVFDRFMRRKLWSSRRRPGHRGLVPASFPREPSP